ncbi:glycosyltransferase family 4 protein [Phenylobacterium sp.]|uniref:glycosyltransferase family 4 protein n=1 Tax=Phenylobacterium sp. TaxID=1871053 RepID=UPI002C95FADA|nr:glycosyltransferase family 4 protein [Phenylobacterium sp.]HLZ73659.1 glycosyltransferase family 4 protein [Phenylobacterium sp.]
MARGPCRPRPPPRRPASPSGRPGIAASRPAAAGSGNAAIYFDREPYDAALARPLGRQSAGEGFLRGFLQHADVEQVYLWNVRDRPVAEFAPLLERLGPPGKPLTWIGPDRAALAAPGAVHIPTPELRQEAWARREAGAASYSLTGVTHTIAEHHIMAEIAGLLIGPVETWDALICTSPAVQSAVQTQLAAVAEYLHDRFGVTRMPAAQLVTIPLGVHTQDFTPDPEARRRWRDALDVPQDAFAALYFGRFNIATKMNPAPMGLALQEAARRTRQPVYWILFGGTFSPDADQAFREAAQAFCPDVQLRFVGEAQPDAHGPIWSAADAFISFSDNVQESFGLTVPEAMAAGLPCVVSDWDGYRASLRHGTDGFLIRTTTPRPGLGADLAYRYAHGIGGYDRYFIAQSQFTAVDVERAGQALAALIQDPERRARMGASAMARARSVFDWKAVIPQYQTLWRELERRRRAAPAQAPGVGLENPWALDPFRMFAAYPSHTLAHTDTVQLTRAFAPADLAAIMAAPSVRGAESRLPTLPQTEALIAALSHDRPAAVGAILSGFPPQERPFLERGLVWLAKYGLVRFSRVTLKE